MRIYIIANFTNSNTSRFIELAQMFADNGHDVVLLTSDFNHVTKSHQQPMLPYSEFRVEYLHEPQYPNNISIKRLYSHYCWGKSVEKYLNTHERPDVIYCALPSLTAGSKAVDYCKKNNVKFVVDIQDLWPEAFCLIIKNKILQLGLKPMEWLANKSYAYADLVIGVSNTYRDRGLCVNKKDKNGLTVFLGNHLDRFEFGKQNYHKDKPENEFWIAYIGTIGYSYDILCVIDGIAKYNTKHPNGKHIKFIAMGHGPLINQFKEQAKRQAVDVQFTGGLPYEEMVGLMCSCDVVANVIRKGAAQSITNKVGDYAFSGLAVINTQECQEYQDIVEQYGCGINCECGNSDQVADAITRLINNPILCKKMGTESRKLGEDKFDRTYTYPMIIDAVEIL
jgi:glycosyltransferase involved in cell wall biosynthesis